MGGYMGLLIGGSVITLFEILDLVLYNCLRKMAHARKVAPTRSKVININVQERVSLS